MTSPQKRVVIVGAGVAGLAAAVVLAESGVAVTVLEAKEQVGGRILTVDAGGVPVELGAEFVHGKPPELLALLRSLGLNAIELDGEMVYHTSEHALRTKDGKPVQPSDASPAPQHDGDGEGDADPMEAMEQLRSWTDAHTGSDTSFATWAAQQGMPADVLRRATAYVEGFNAADAEEVSLRSLAVQQAAEDSMDGQTALHLDDGGLCRTAATAGRAAAGRRRRASAAHPGCRRAVASGSCHSHARRWGLHRRGRCSADVAIRCVAGRVRSLRASTG